MYTEDKVDSNMFPERKFDKHSAQNEFYKRTDYIYAFRSYNINT